MGKPNNKKHQSKRRKEKKREKRRAARREEVSLAGALPWEKLDVSAWFETSFPGGMESVQTNDSCLSPYGLYEGLTPAECTLTYWAATHPDQEKEVQAAVLAVSLAALCPAEGREAQGQTAQGFSALSELAALAEGGSVTANAVLGAWHLQGRNVCLDQEKAKGFLLFAADQGDPYSNFLLAEAGFFPDRTEELYRRSRKGGCPSAFVQQARQFLSGIEVPPAELEAMADYLTAFAARKCLSCLTVLVQFLEACKDQDFLSEYAESAADILRRTAQTGSPEAAELLAGCLERGVLCYADFAEAKEMYRTAMLKGSAKAGWSYARCLINEALDLPEAEAQEARSLAYSILRENCRQKKEEGRSYGLLGFSLTCSDDDAEFREGLRCLEKCLPCKEFTLPLNSINCILTLKNDPKRRASALKLLDSLAALDVPDAFFAKGLYSLLGFDKSLTREQSFELLLKAARLGEVMADSTLAAIYLFGFFGVRVNAKKALTFAIEGHERGSREAHYWRLLIELGELSKASKSIAGMVRDTETAACELWDIFENESNDFITIIGTLLYLGAADISPKIEDYYHPKKAPNPFFPLSSRFSSTAFADACVNTLREGNIFLIPVIKHALQIIGRTWYVVSYYKELNVRLGLPEDKLALCRLTSCLDEYLENFPESLFKFRERQEEPGSE